MRRRMIAGCANLGAFRVERSWIREHRGDRNGLRRARRGRLPRRERQLRHLRRQRRREGRTAARGARSRSTSRASNELVPRNVAEERLRFTTDLAEAVRTSEVAVHRGRHAPGRGRLGRPHATCSRWRARSARSMNGYKVIVNKSTVPGGHRGARARGGRRAHEAPLRGRLQPRVPEGGHGGRRLPEARPRRDRHRRPEGRGGHARALRALRAHGQADPGDGPGLGRAHASTRRTRCWPRASRS